MQGREAPVVFLSCVRAGGGGSGGGSGGGRPQLGFLSDPRRINVAFSRARESLVVVGAAGALEADRLWRGGPAGSNRRSPLVTRSCLRLPPPTTTTTAAIVDSANACLSCPTSAHPAPLSAYSRRSAPARPRLSSLAGRKRLSSLLQELPSRR